MAHDSLSLFPGANRSRTAIVVYSVRDTAYRPRSVAPILGNTWTIRFECHSPKYVHGNTSLLPPFSTVSQLFFKLQSMRRRTIRIPYDILKRQKKSIVPFPNSMLAAVKMIQKDCANDLPEKNNGPFFGRIF